MILWLDFSFPVCYNGLINRIVVKKYDRFSRNLRDYLNVSEELDKLGVSVYSLSEPFNTSTKEERMMRNNLLNFAEFERETIAGRIAAAYNARGRETGFYQGSLMNFVYITEHKEDFSESSKESLYSIYRYDFRSYRLIHQYGDSQLPPDVY